MAVVVTIALVPVATAYLQLGYTTATRTDHHTTAANVDRALAQAVSYAAGETTGRYDWTDRTDAIEHLHQTLDPRLESLESPTDPNSIAVTIAYNQSHASHVAATECPTGPGRDFGPCRASRGIVVQERAGETVILGVALDLIIVTPDSRMERTKYHPATSTS